MRGRGGPASGSEVTAVAVLELLAAATGAWVVASRQLVGGEGAACLLAAGVLSGGGLLGGVVQVGRSLPGIVGAVIAGSLRGAGRCIVARGGVLRC